MPNLPTEELFTTPDPERTEGVVTSTKPLDLGGSLVTGLRIRFERGRAVEIEADDERGGAARALCVRTKAPRGSARWRSSTARAASGASAGPSSARCSTRTRRATSRSATPTRVRSAIPADLPRINESEIHIDFMIGSDEVTVSGVTRAGDELPLLVGGAWQI